MTSNNIGVSVAQALTGTIPEPKHILRWGEDIPPKIMQALRNGETALLHDADGKPHRLILMDYYGTIREMSVNTNAAAQRKEAQEER